jgi:hypothetical protein
MKLSVIGHNVLGSVPHANGDIRLRFSIHRPRLKNILAIIILLDLLQCRYPSYETCAKKI